MVSSPICDSVIVPVWAFQGSVGVSALMNGMGLEVGAEGLYAHDPPQPDMPASMIISANTATPTLLIIMKNIIGYNKGLESKSSRLSFPVSSTCYEAACKLNTRRAVEVCNRGTKLGSVVAFLAYCTDEGNTDKLCFPTAITPSNFPSPEIAKSRNPISRKIGRGPGCATAISFPSVISVSSGKSIHTNSPVFFSTARFNNTRCSSGAQ